MGEVFWIFMMIVVFFSLPYGIWVVLSAVTFSFLSLVAIGFITDYVDFGRVEIFVKYFVGFIGAGFGIKVAKAAIAEQEQERMEKLMARKQGQRAQQPYNDFTDNAANDGFGFDAGRFGAKPPPPQPDENAPRGYDKRHPDDAKFWAFVDDPETPENEAISALRKIRERERQRKKRGIPPT